MLIRNKVSIYQNIINCDILLSNKFICFIMFPSAEFHCEFNQMCLWCGSGTSGRTQSGKDGQDGTAIDIVWWHGNRSRLNSINDAWVQRTYNRKWISNIGLCKWYELKWCFVLNGIACLQAHPLPNAINPNAIMLVIWHDITNIWVLQDFQWYCQPFGVKLPHHWNVIQLTIGRNFEENSVANTRVAVGIASFGVSIYPSKVVP